MSIIKIEILSDSHPKKRNIYSLYDPKIVNIGDQPVSELYMDTSKISLLGKPRRREWVGGEKGQYSVFYGFEIILDGQIIIFGSQFGILKISHFSNLPADNSNFEMLKSLDKNLVNQLYEQLKGFFISEN